MTTVMEPLTYILLGFTLGLLAVMACREYIQWWQRRAIRKVAHNALEELRKTMRNATLRLQLEEAEAREDFEEAARIRDLMKKG